MREETEYKPKPLVEIGGKPVLFHIMNWFARFGHTEFIVLTGYRGHQIKEYFLNFNFSNHDVRLNLARPDSTETLGGKNGPDWDVTILDTGSETPTGGRLFRARETIGPEPFICTYGDGLANVDIGALVEFHRSKGLTGTVTGTRPSSRFGVIRKTDDNLAKEFVEKPEMNDLVSIGYFVFGGQIWSELHDQSTLEVEPLSSLAVRKELAVFDHEGFWQPMDTYREFLALNHLWDSGRAPWA